jgi:3-dehydroquinate dehydratase type I
MPSAQLASPEKTALPNRVAVSLALPDTEACLAALAQLGPRIGMAEIRLDLMERFDLARLIAAAPCPLILTCRPPREMGRFSGSEAERLAILAQAIRLEAAYVDVEWDSVAALTERSRTRVIVSRHWPDRMPGELWSIYEGLRDQADAVKLVGLAARPLDMLPIFELLARARGPVIAIGMGAAGQLTRLLAPCFPACLLTYGAAAATSATAAGQLSVDEMLAVYQLQHVGPHTAIQLHLCASAMSSATVSRRNAAAPPGAVLYAPLIVTAEQATELLPGLRAYLPRLTISADPALGLDLAAHG